MAGEWPTWKLALSAWFGLANYRASYKSTCPNHARIHFNRNVLQSRMDICSFDCRFMSIQPECQLKVGCFAYKFFFPCLVSLCCMLWSWCGCLLEEDLMSFDLETKFVLTYEANAVIPFHFSIIQCRNSTSIDFVTNSSQKHLSELMHGLWNQFWPQINFKMFI